MTLEELKRIAMSVGERQGWDSPRVRDEGDERQNTTIVQRG